MIKFTIPPDSSSYSVSDGIEVIRTRLDGGFSRYRKDILNASSIVSVSWLFDRDQYDYFRSFYRGLLNKGSAPFLIDLVIDSFELTEHRAYFVPDSVKLNSQEGCAHFVSAQLEIEPADDLDKGDFANIYGEFGKTWALDLDLLDMTVNVDWPMVL